MTPDDLLRALVAAGALEDSQTWVATPLGGGLNTRVFRLRSQRDPTGYIARVREPANVAGEAAALADAAGCPGVPDVLYAGGRILVHRFLDGEPHSLAEAEPKDLARLMSALACLHRRTYPNFTPWPEQERVAGTRADLFRNRVATLHSYESFAPAATGEIDPRLPGLLAALDALEMPDEAGWSERRFARLHGDLSIGNILWRDEGVGLIDWEYSRVGDPAEDLAYLLTEQGAALGLAGTIRDAYLAAGGDPRAWRRVPAYGLFTGVDSALWWADYMGRNGAQRGAREIAARIETAARWFAG